jgi:transposase
LSKVFCGIDWAENHHDIALVDQDGTQLAKLRISDDSAGFNALLELLARPGDSSEEPIPVAIETPRGLLVAGLRATGRKVYAINPLAAARYRDRSSVARAKSDAADARVLANILRTDMAAHRPVPADSELVQAVAVLARAHQDAIWDKTQMVNRLRSHLREYFPAALHAFHGAGTLGLGSRHARAVLAAAPTPAAAARLTRSQLRALLNRAGRSDAGSTPRSNGSGRSSAGTACTTCRRSNRPWAGRSRPSFSSSTPPAGAPTTSRRLPRKRSSPTRTRRSSPAFPGCR